MSLLEPVNLRSVRPDFASDHSDGCSSERSSMGSPCGSPSARPPIPPVESQRRGSLASSAGSRPLCLDYLNGNCGRQRSRCRYYHPTPEEAVGLFTTSRRPVDPQRPVCEVWSLTGFCKFGARCWKQHPDRAPQADGPAAEPVTRKFQEWLLTRAHPQPRKAPSTPVKPLGAAAAPSATLLEAIKRLRGSLSPPIEMPTDPTAARTVLGQNVFTPCLADVEAAAMGSVAYVHNPYTPL
eukprot:EG_transcript_4747